MPMKSQAQRSYLHMHLPHIAEMFESETPKDAKLPKKVGKKKKKEKK